MPVNEIVRFCTDSNTNSRIAFLLAMNCAPILKGSKAASICTISEEESIHVHKMFTGTRISYCFWRIGEGRVILYLYRSKALKKHLNKCGTKKFLLKYGYDVSSLENMLCILSKRICQHSDGEIEFPHEIGVFLGYPLEDVRGYIDNAGNNCAFVGYWKVYKNVEAAMNLFHQYDMEREQAIQEIVSGKTIREIAV